MHLRTWRLIRCQHCTKVNNTMKQGFYNSWKLTYKEHFILQLNHWKVNSRMPMFWSNEVNKCLKHFPNSLHVLLGFAWLFTTWFMVFSPKTSIWSLPGKIKWFSVWGVMTQGKIIVSKVSAWILIKSNIHLDSYQQQYHPHYNFSLAAVDNWQNCWPKGYRRGMGEKQHNIGWTLFWQGEFFSAYNR